MRIIPAIDIIEGKCVRLSEGKYESQKIYYNDPLEFAKELEDFGFEYLHLVDLDGAKSKQIVNHQTLEKIASKTKLKIDFGGGIKRIEDVELAFNSGANQITCGSIAVTNPDLVLECLTRFGTDKIILGADVKNKKIATNAWLKQTDIELFEFINSYQEKGVKNVICTDISKDGMLQGASFDLYVEILAKCKVNLIASGGVSSLEDLHRLKTIGCEGAIVGKAIYENKISLNELKELC